jgi:hypothetical protein
MTRFQFVLLRIVPGLALVAACVAPAFAQKRARFVEVQVEQAVQQAEDVDVVDEVVAQPVFEWGDANFEQWMYQDLQNAAGARARLDSQLTMRLDELTVSCELTEAQRQKLQLAGRGDIKRFFDRVEELRRKFQTVRTDQNRIGEIVQAMQPLQMTLRAGVFNENSLFAKAVRTTLSSEQSQRSESSERERRRFRYQAEIEKLVSKLDDDLAMVAEERQQFVELLLAETRPPANFSQYDGFVALAQAAHIPDEKLKNVFDATQLKLLKKHFEQAKGIEPFLKANGFHPDSPPGAGAGAGAAGIAPAMMAPMMMPGGGRRVRVIQGF